MKKHGLYWIPIIGLYWIFKDSSMTGEMVLAVGFQSLCISIVICAGFFLTLL